VQRFVFTERYCKPGKPINPAAMLPQAKYPNELSVYREIGLTQECLWQIGDKYIGSKMNPNKRTLVGLKLDVIEVEKIHNDISKKYLGVRRDPFPHKNHANILNVGCSSPKDQLIALKLMNIVKTPPIRRN